MTFTGEEAHTPLPLPRMTTGEHRIAEQLDKAPSLRTSSSESETVSDLPPVLGIPALPRAPTLPVLRDDRRWLVPVLALLAGAAILAIILVARGLGGDGEQNTPKDPPKTDPVVANTSIAAPPPTGSDKTVAKPLEPPPRTIASLSAAGDWIGVLQLCIVTPSRTAEERTSCALAACNARQRSVAYDYYAAAPASARTTIERTCSVSGIALRAPGKPSQAKPRSTPKTTHDAECDADPLACQK